MGRGIRPGTVNYNRISLACGQELMHQCRLLFMSASYTSSSLFADTPVAQALHVLSEHCSGQLARYVKSSCHLPSAHKAFINMGWLGQQHEEEEEELKLVPQLPALLGLSILLAATTPTMAATAGVATSLNLTSIFLCLVLSHALVA